MSFISFNVSLKTCVSLLIFYFDDLSIGVSGVLKSHTIIVFLWISPFMSVMITAAMKLKDAYSLEEKLWPT